MGCGAERKLISDPKNITITPLQFVGGIKTNFSKNYKVIQLLGKGTHGDLYVCAQRDTGITRAVHIKRRLDLRGIEEKLFNELEILSRIDHPNVVKLFEVYEDSKNYYVVNELLMGGDLLEHITQAGSFNEHDAAVIMKQILSAVAYCHSKNIIHRNIKPHNVLYESNEKSAKVKLVNFGFSEMLEEDKKSSSTLGTISYIAPEVFKKSHDKKCDIWSCGVVLYLLLCGSLPFTGDTTEKIIEKILKGEYTMKGKVWESVSEGAKNLVFKMLTYNPKDRISAEQAFAHEWLKVYCSEKVNKEMAKDMLGELKNFNTKCKLQQAALTYIVTQLTTKSETKDLREVFLSLDKTGRGELTKEDLIKGFKEIYGDRYEEQEIVENIMKNLDADQNGYINYTEFAVATIDKRKILSKERLQAAFKTFDKDGSGKISISEIRNVLSGNDEISKERWNDIVKQVDKNGDGEISIEEFIELMEKLLTD